MSTVSALPAGSGEQAKSAQPSASVRATTVNPDVFDVPSEDEYDLPPTSPAKKSVLQRSQTEGGSRGGNATKAAALPIRSDVSVIPPPQRRAVAKATDAGAKLSYAQSKPQQPAKGKAALPALPSTFANPQAKASQPIQSQKQAPTNGLPRTNSSSRDTLRATTPGYSKQTAADSTRTSSVAHPTRSAESALKPSAELDVFDVPSDTETASLPIPKAPCQLPRQAPKSIAKKPEAAKVASLDASRKVPVKADNLGSLQNRKRKGSVSLTTTVKSAAGAANGVPTVRRDRKVVKRGPESSPHREQVRAPNPAARSQATTRDPVINKPKRTRMRTVPYVTQPTMTKGQSSPAVLNKMLPIELTPRGSYADTGAEVPASDDTMYDIPDAATTPMRSTSLRRTTSLTPGSVTPRQKDLFDTLLIGSTAPKTPASALASLQLTDKKPRSLLGALARSKSDVAHSNHSKKTRLIATLKDKDTSSEDDDSDSDIEVEGTVVVGMEAETEKTPVPAKRTLVMEQDDSSLDADEPSTVDSQTSQFASLPTARPRLTYASQRSYLQEENPEDDFFMSMDIDDNWKMDSQTVSTDEDDGPTSQPRTHHELKKHGQNTMFSWDMEESIREISDVANRSARRSALMDLCTKMADAGFISQLLDSGFMHKLLSHMLLTGDIILDFVASVSILFVLQTKPAFAVVNQIYHSNAMATLMTLVDKESDIARVARDRRSNMSKIAQESLADFRALILRSQEWPSSVPDQVAPQLAALRTVDILTRRLRESGSTDALLNPVDVSKTVNVCSVSSKRIESGKFSDQDLVVLDSAMSILETVSIADQDYSTWPPKVLEQLSEAMPTFFRNDSLFKTVEALKLCMHITNNKPKSCQPFSTQGFIGSLARYIVDRFDRLDAELGGDVRAQVLAELTLSLGAMINLAELSDRARLNAIANTDLIEALVKVFQAGSEHADEASSVEETSVSVVIGFLAVLLGMLCLNTTARSQIQAIFPGQKLQPMLDIMKQFARIHEHVDKKTVSRFDGPEGQKTLNNYFTRIMHVVRKLETAEP